MDVNRRLLVIRKAAVFLDRDGVINRKMPDGAYVTQWNEFQLLPGVIDALKVLTQKNMLTIVVTNQRCIARGLLTETALVEIHEKMCREMAHSGVSLSGIYYCPHENNESCGCRKPEPGMILRAIEDFRDKGIDIDRSKSFMIGDSEKDVLAGRAAGLNTIFIGEQLLHADMSASSLIDAVRSLTEGRGVHDH